MSLSAECPQLLTPVCYRVTPRVAPTVKVFWFAVGGLLVSGAGLGAGGAGPEAVLSWSPATWGLVTAQAVLGLLGVYCRYRAISLASPTRVMVIRSFEVVFSYLLQVTVFGLPARTLDCLGALMIVLAVLAIAAEKYLTDKLKVCSWF